MILQLKKKLFKYDFLFRWTHIVCALYIPGVAFGDVDKLSPVTIFEMPTTKWGAKVSLSLLVWSNTPWPGLLW